MITLRMKHLRPVVKPTVLAFNLPIILFTKHSGRVVSTPALYQANPLFVCRSEGRLSWLRVIGLRKILSSFFPSINRPITWCYTVWPTDSLIKYTTSRLTEDSFSSTLWLVPPQITSGTETQWQMINLCECEINYTNSSSLPQQANAENTDKYRAARGIRNQTYTEHGQAHLNMRSERDRLVCSCKIVFLLRTALGRLHALKVPIIVWHEEKILYPTSRIVECSLRHVKMEWLRLPAAWNILHFTSRIIMKITYILALISCRNGLIIEPILGFKNWCYFHNN